jgi:hypothetical protein
VRQRYVVSGLSDEAFLHVFQRAIHSTVRDLLLGKARVGRTASSEACLAAWRSSTGCWPSRAPTRRAAPARGRWLRQEVEQLVAWERALLRAHPDKADQLRRMDEDQRASIREQWAKRRAADAS